MDATRLGMGLINLPAGVGGPHWNMLVDRIQELEREQYEAYEQREGIAQHFAAIDRLAKRLAAGAYDRLDAPELADLADISKRCQLAVAGLRMGGAA